MPGWARIIEWANQHIENAHEAMSENQSSDPAIAFRLQLRWRERKQFLDVLMETIADVRQQKQELLKAIAHDNGITITEADRFQGEMNG